MQKKSLVAVLILASALLLSSVPMFAQAAQSVPGAAATPHSVTDQDIQMLREDIRSQRKQITAANLTLTADEATKFWPIYDQYAAELTKIGDTRWALIKDYAQNYGTMTDAQANDYIKRSNSVDQLTSATRMKYVPMFEKVVSAKKAALWFQIDRRLSLLIDLQLASTIPVVDPSK
jgi:hypothetical protein